MNFNERLQQLRKEKGLSQEALAEKIGISRQAIAKWELGQTYPEIDNLIALSDLFKVSIDRLVKPDDSFCRSNKQQYIETYSELISFLCRAGKATYAGSGPKVKSSRPNSQDYLYEEADYKFIDTYIGGEKFAGEEAIWVKDLPIWFMNYGGRLLAEGYSYDFLMEALQHCTEEMPYRGPELYRNGDYTYHCNVRGTFGWFQGYEDIFYRQQKIYECYFQGGMIR